MSRILIIDDDPSAAWVADALALPYEVERVRGPLDALRLLRRRAFDVVVTSGRTQIDDDLALLEEIRRLRPAVKAIVLAPSATPPEVIAALRADVFACMLAPFNAAEIRDAIATAADADEWHGGIQVISARPEWISLRVTCSLLTADRLVGFMTALRTDIPESERDDLLTAFREILLNAMEHGAGFDPEKVVEVSAVRTERAVVYYFHDPGSGFDGRRLSHSAMTNPEANPLAHLERRAAEGLRPGGFGILVARQLVDEVIYSEAGNEVLLIKHVDRHDVERTEPRDDQPRATTH